MTRQTRRFHFLTVISSLGMIAGSTTAVRATPYAANVFNTTGSTWQFTLNQSADDVKVLRNGGNAVDLGALSAGPHTFDMTGFSSFNIQVKKSAPTAWTSISDPSNQFDDFNSPSGVAINTTPTDLKYFGTVYVDNSATGTTGSGRTVGEGIYSLTSDMKGVNLAGGFTPVASANDTTQAKISGFGVDTADSSSPYRISLDAGGNVLIADWSDSNGGVKYMSRDLTSGGRVLGGTDLSGNNVPDGSGTGPSGGVFADQMDQFGRLPLHGSVVGTPYSTGTVGHDLTLFTMDEDLDVDLSAPNNDTNSIWRYNVGAATEYRALAPTVVVKSTSIPTTTDGGANFIGAFGGGVIANMTYDPTFQKWYITNARSSGTAGNGASLIVVSANPDGSQAGSPTVLWSSRQFSLDNNLDADTTTPEINDILRHAADVAISPDHKFLLVHRNATDTAHAGIGAGDILVLPLDANGIPQLTVSGGAVTNVVDFSENGGQAAHTFGDQIGFDAAGNLYVANNNAAGQLVQVFSPGGNWISSTNSDGTFTMTAITGGVPGDYNGNGVVDMADYVLWRNGGPLQNEVNSLGTVDASDYTAWRARFGNTSGSGSSLAGKGAAVPEPGTLVMAMLGVFFTGCGRKRRAQEMA
jgi:hypothetical protein